MVLGKNREQLRTFVACPVGKKIPEKAESNPIKLEPDQAAQGKKVHPIFRSGMPVVIDMALVFEDMKCTVGKVLEELKQNKSDQGYKDIFGHRTRHFTYCPCLRK